MSTISGSNTADVRQYQNDNRQLEAIQSSFPTPSNQSPESRDGNYYFTPRHNSVGSRESRKKQRPLSASKDSESTCGRVHSNSLASTFYKTNTSSFSGPETGRIPLKTLFNVSYGKDLLNSVDQMDAEIPLWNQSASTWRRSSPKIKFPQSDRFPDEKLPGKYINTFSVKTTLKKRSTSFGYGKKTDIFPFKHIEKGRTTPAPDSHNIKRFLEDQSQYKIRYPNPTVHTPASSTPQEKGCCSGRQSRSNSFINSSTTREKSSSIEPGKSFGLSFEHYQKNYQGHANKLIYSPLLQINNPPPNAYEIAERIGLTKRRHSILKRLKMFNELGDQTLPSSTKYVVGEKLVTPSRFTETTFGKGNKINIAEPLNDNPGPKYNVVREFDNPPPYYLKFKRIN